MLEETLTLSPIKEGVNLGYKKIAGWFAGGAAIAGGLYAMFEYKGSSKDNSIFQYIYTSWLPNSTYVLDDRPHFEVLGKKYKNNDPNSEEEIWIPIK